MSGIYGEEIYLVISECMLEDRELWETAGTEELEGAIFIPVFIPYSHPPPPTPA